MNYLSTSMYVYKNLFYICVCLAKCSVHIIVRLPFCVHTCVLHLCTVFCTVVCVQTLMSFLSKSYAYTCVSASVKTVAHCDTYVFEWLVWFWGPPPEYAVGGGPSDQFTTLHSINNNISSSSSSGSLAQVT